jgi:hypothetical protein
MTARAAPTLLLGVDGAPQLALAWMQPVQAISVTLAQHVEDHFTGASTLPIVSHHHASTVTLKRLILQVCHTLVATHLLAW